MVSQQSQIANLVATFSANNDQLIQVARQNERIFRKQSQFVGSLNKHFDNLNRTVSFVSKAFLGLVGILGTSALANYARGISDTVTEFVEFGRQVDLSTRQVQLLDRVFQGDGASIRQVRTGLNNLARQLSDTTVTSTETRNAFSALGLDVDELKNKEIGLYDVLQLISDGLKNVEDQTKRVAIANTLFGRSGIKLLLPLQQGAQALEDQVRAMERLGFISQAQGDRLKDLSQTFTDFDNALSSSSYQILAELTPNLQSLLKWLTEVVVSIKDNLIPVFNLLNEHGIEIAQRGLALLPVLLLRNIKLFSLFNNIIGTSGGALRSLGAALTVVGKAIVTVLKGIFSAVRIFILVEGIVFLVEVVKQLSTRLDEAGLSFIKFSKLVGSVLLSNVAAAFAVLPIIILEALKVTVPRLVEGLFNLIRVETNAPSYWGGVVKQAEEGAETTKATFADAFKGFGASMSAGLREANVSGIFNKIKIDIKESLGANTEEARTAMNLFIGSITEAGKKTAGVWTNLFGGVEKRAQETSDKITESVNKITENIPKLDVTGDGGLGDGGLGDVDEKINEVKDSFKELATEINRGVGRAFGEFAGRFVTDVTNMRDNLRSLISDIQSAVIRAAIVEPIAQGIAGGLSGITGFQHGGLAKGFSIVGEGGPELVDFSTPARVYPNEDLRHALSGGGGEVTINLNQTFNGTVNPAEIRNIMYGEVSNLTQMIKQHLNLELTRPSQFRNRSLRGR